MRDWTVEPEECVHDFRWFQILRKQVRSPDGTDGIFTFFAHPGSVFVVPVTAEGKFVLIRSFRFTTDSWTWEVPAGSMHDRVGMSPELVAKEELAEEAGMVAERLDLVAELHLGNGYSRHRAQFFVAHNATQIGPSSPDALERIERSQEFSIGELGHLIESGELSDGDSLLAIFLSYQRHTLTATGN